MFVTIPSGIEYAWSTGGAAATAGAASAAADQVRLEVSAAAVTATVAKAIRRIKVFLQWARPERQVGVKCDESVEL